MEETNAIVEAANWKPKALIIGAVIGALVGVGAAYLFAQRVEAENGDPTIKPVDGVRLGVMVLGLLRSIAELGESGK
jgi:hypothetical protein